MPSTSLRLLAPALLLSLGSLAPGARSSASQDADGREGFGALLTQGLAAVEGAPLESIWSRAAELRDVARELGGDGLDGEIDRRLGQSGVSESGRLLLSSARLAGADPDPATLAAALEPLLDSAREDYASGAAGLLADAVFRSLPEERRSEVLKSLKRVAEDGARAPAVRIEAACGLFELGWGDERRAAREVMSAFLSAGEAGLRAQGALALARTGAEVSGPLYDELRRLALVSDARGEQAAVYLELEEVRREANRKVKRAQEFYSGEDSSAATGAGGAAQPQGAEAMQQLRAVISLVERGHLEGDKVSRQELLDAAMDGMLRSLDEHSSYLPPTAYARFEQELEAGYGGIGAYVGEDREDNLFTITHPIYSGPAYKAGLLSDDKIVRIEDWPTIGEPVDDIIKRLKGRPGTPVKLYVWRRGMDPGLIDRPSEEMAVTIVRASITIPAVQSQMLPGGVGMVALHDFSRVAVEELRQPLESMLAQGMRAVILDLRNNNGGLLDQAVEVAGLFLPRGSVVVKTESRVEPDRTYNTSRPPMIPPDMPLIVLVNRFSASAAEIVAGTLQDHGRAVLIGKRTFGKGSVQNLYPIAVDGPLADDRYEDENENHRHDNWERITKDWNGNGEFDYSPRIKMTIARYRLQPSGRSIHREVDREGNEISRGGIEPDRDVDARRMDAWRYEELYKLQTRHVVRDYLDQLVSQNAERSDWLRERLFQIADNDRKDLALYPGFEEFYNSLDTPLVRDDVRQLVRAEVRRRVQDARGREFPPGDFVEDAQLQDGIRQALARLSDSPESYPDYAGLPAAGDEAGRLAAIGSDSVREALGEIEKARQGDGKLSEETLRKLAEMLERKRADGQDH